MEWINNFFIQEPFFFVIPVVIIIGVFVCAAYRAQIKHVERIKKIDERYRIETNSKTSSDR
jgi:preprotein translocase subunit YajC